MPTQETLLASLRAFVLSNPGALNTWRPTATVGDDQDLYQQQAAPPLLYPSITEAWTRAD